MKSYENREEIEKTTFEALKKIINKFRENPRYFFSESDLHSYFYHCLYSTKMEFKSNGIGLQAIHREYPTNFKYNKQELKEEGFAIPEEPLSQEEGSRGHYDMAVLAPEFIENSELDWLHIRNKDGTLTDKRKKTKNPAKELLFAVEFKYVINDSKNFMAEVWADNKKLLMAQKTQAIHAVNLVFCDLDLTGTKNLDNIKNEVVNADDQILTVFINSYYDKDNKKITPKPVSNKNKYADLLI